MKKLFLALALALALTLTTFAFADSQNPALYGTWDAGTIVTAGPLQIALALKFAPEGLTATTTCSLNGQAAHASVTGSYDATMDTITVTSNAQNAVNENGIDCNVSIKADTMNYKVDGNTLTLSMNGQTMTLNKVQ